MYAEVAVCLPLSRTFVYKIGEPVEIGCRVTVPFRKRDMEGFVVGVRNEGLDDIEIHPITNIIDQAPLLRPEVFRLCRWISEYYVSPLGEVLKSALPPGISQKHLGKPVGPVGEAQARQRAASRNHRPRRYAPGVQTCRCAWARSREAMPISALRQEARHSIPKSSGTAGKSPVSTAATDR